MSPDYRALQGGFQLGSWTVIPNRGLLRQGNDDIHLEPMVMDVLLVLASNHGQVVTRDQIVEKVWRGRATSDDAIAVKIGALRSRLGDDSRNPVYIETVQKRGYRLKDSVSLQLLVDQDPPGPAQAKRKLTMLLAVVLLAVAIAVVALLPRDEPIDSIGVIPFNNLSADKDAYQYIVDGFAEELVVSLGRIPDMRITRGRSAAGNAAPQETARDLDVDALITGTLRTDGNRLRITLALTSVHGSQLWADSIDGASQDIIGFQERVANHVANKILGLGSDSLQLASRPSNYEAFDTYMRGLFFLAKRDLPSLQQANNLFEQTIQLDPDFGSAYFRQAVTQLLLADYMPSRRREIYDAALAIARSGAQHDKDIRDPIQLIHAFVNHQRGNWAEADNAFKIAFRGSTIFPAIHHWHARFLGDLGLLDQALEDAKLARAIEPASQILNTRLAVAYLWQNDMDNARYYFDVANAMGVGVPDHQLGYALFLLRDHRPNEARRAAKLAFELAQRRTDWVNPVFDSLASPEDAELRRIAMATLDAQVIEQTLPAYVSMTIWALFGDADKAMHIALREAATKGVIYELEIVFTDEFAEFRRHPRFPDLLDSLGVSAHWANIGCRWNGERVVCDSD